MEEKKMGRMIILSGAVGAGKTTVAKELVKELGLVYIEGDTYWEHIKYGKNEDGGFDKRCLAILRAMVSSAVGYAASGFDVLLDFTIQPWYLNGVFKLMGTKKIRVDYIVLRPSESVCMERSKTREKGKIEDYTMFHDMYEAFNEVPNHIIANDSADILQVTSILEKELQGDKFLLTPRQ